MRMPMLLYRCVMPLFSSDISYCGTDLADPDGFCDYDDDADVPVSIADLEWKFEAIAEGKKRGKK